MKSVSILGSTGSIGANTLDVVHARSDLFLVHALTAQSNVELLAKQAKEVNATLAVIGDDSLLPELQNRLSCTKTKVAGGRDAIIAAASDKADYTMAAIVGMAGLEPLLAAIANGNHVAIANKEPMVAAGALVMEAANKSGATLLPVDSEHNAVFQLLDPANKGNLRRIILTASGGPFRTWSESQIQAATPAQAVAHPNWSMGAKISVDSATMMNKALEIIEAHFLFGLPPEQIDVLIHPQSIVHSMVEYHDGSVLAHMGASDMRVPITHTLGWPDRIEGTAQRLDVTKMSQLSFEPIDARRFPAINLAYDCLKQGQAACIALNAANEVAVAAFLAERIGFADIFDIVRTCVAQDDVPSIKDLNGILAYDQKMRNFAETCIVETKSHPKRKVS